MHNQDSAWHRFPTTRQQMTSFSSKVSPNSSVTHLVVFLPLLEYAKDNSSSPAKQKHTISLKQTNISYNVTTIIIITSG